MPRMMLVRRDLCTSLLLAGASLAMGSSARAAGTDVIPKSALVQVGELVALLKGTPPTILQVGFRKLYDQAHIPGAIYAGPGRSDEGLANLKAHAQGLDRGAALVIYCGCCPWDRCPNMGAAYTALKAMSFTQLKALYIPDDFGRDWADKGYPVVRGS